MTRRYGGNVARLLFLGALLALAGACTPQNPQSTFDALGPVARDQRFIFLLIFWLGVFVFITVEGALLYTIFRFRRRPGVEAREIHGNNTLEVAWTIAPAIILIIAAVPTVRVIFSSANSPLPPEKGGLVVEATGNQWWFEFKYDYQGQEVVTANEMVIPVGEPVNLKLYSKDVIHSFWVPKLAGKTDMVPNNENTMWFQADEPGVYYGQCAELCGESHAKMRFRVIAMPRPEFEAWLAKEASPAAPPTDPLAQEGEKVFTQAGCIACHTINGNRVARGRVGPDLTHLASRTTLAAGIMENNQENLRRWLEDPESLKPGNLMSRNAPVYTDPARALTDREISALIAYLQSLK